MPEEKPPPAPAPQRPEIVDSHNAPVIFVDWLVTGGMFNDVINVTLGAVDHSLKRSDEDLARVMIGARLRFSRAFGLGLHRALGDILGLEPRKDETGQAPPSPPKNLIN